jgi:deazaflavin-dependent oxidoreductase (nitroreductase family)
MSEAEKLYGDAHVERYRETGGEVGHIWKEGSTVLLLTTTGRKTGEQRTTPLIYAEDGDRYVIVASKGGAPEDPAWYLNLSDQPEVTVQVLGDRFKARARTAAPDEKPELWQLMTGEWPPYDEYQQKTDREIPVVVLEREA